MRSKIPVVLASASLVLFAACSSAATAPPTATPAATPTAVATSTPAAGTPAATATPAPTVGTPATSACREGAGGSAAVTIQGFAFNPPQLTIKAGTTVTWTNQDATGHTATADGGAFDCRGLSRQGSSVSFTFTAPGTFAYHCAIHSYMKATIIVTS